SPAAAVSVSAVVFEFFVICSSQDEGGKRLVFLPVILRVPGYLCPGDIWLAAPAVEQNTFLERLASGRNYEAIILAHSTGPRLRPVELDRLQLERIQPDEKLGRVLETVSSFSRSYVDE